MRRWMVIVLGLAVAFLQSCSSGTGSSMTGPSSATTGRTGASDTAGGRTGSESGGNQMMQRERRLNPPEGAGSSLSTPARVAGGRFVVQIVRTITKPFVREAVIPYLAGSVLPPTDPFKSLQVGTFAPNCTGEQTLAAMEAKIDSVGVSPWTGGPAS